MRTSRKLLSLFLSAVLCLSLLPMSVLAYADDTVAVIDAAEYTSLSTALSSAAANQTVKVVKDTTITSWAQTKKDCNVEIGDGVTVSVGVNGQFTGYGNEKVHFTGNGTIGSVNNQSPFKFISASYEYYMENGTYIGGFVHNRGWTSPPEGPKCCS